MLRHISKSVAARRCLLQGTHMMLLSERLSGVAAIPHDDRDETLDYFDILGVHRTFKQSSAELKSKYKRLMTEFHPDRHASSAEEEKAHKTFMATNVTRAYSVIGDPLSRALHLLELHGAAIGESESVSKLHALVVVTFDNLFVSFIAKVVLPVATSSIWPVHSRQQNAS
mmetsp:Transcript_25145/g.53531  ORF Transcript_25145/g.53531 Transcript_25145/m.53531 type:complete len:170 (+) Transcript_25145:79-588(+)